MYIIIIRVTSRLGQLGSENETSELLKHRVLYKEEPEQQLYI